jgi:hypothetical protein
VLRDIRAVRVCVQPCWQLPAELNNKTVHPPKKKTERQKECTAEEKENGLKDRSEKTESRREN